MNAYINIQKVNFINAGNNNYNCYLTYEFTGYKRLVTFNIQLTEGQSIYVYVNAVNNSVQISSNTLNIQLQPHIFYLKLQRVNNYIKILEVHNADYIINSVITTENNIYAYLDNIYMLSSLLLENKQDIENLEIALKEEIKGVFSSINNISSKLLDIEQINNQQNIQIDNLKSSINTHENNVFSLLDNIYMLSSLLLENKQDIENLEIALREEIRGILENINNILTRLLNIELINTQQDNRINTLRIYTEEINSSYYSSYVVTNNLNTVTPELGMLVYITTTNELYKYTTNGWTKIHWQKIIQTMPEYQINRLRINNGMLEISPDGTNWYPCFPLVGAMAFNIRTLDNQNYTYKYYLPPSATVTIENANHVPIVYTPGSIYNFVVYFSFGYEDFVGLRPSNIAISNGNGQWASGVNTSNGAGRFTYLSIVPMSEMGNSPENWFQSTLIIHYNQRMFTLSHSKSYSSFGVSVHTGSGTAPSTSYWLGTWYRQDGVQFTADYVTITRRR